MTILAGECHSGATHGEPWPSRGVLLASSKDSQAVLAPGAGLGLRACTHGPTGLAALCTTRGEIAARFWALLDVCLTDAGVLPGPLLGHAEGGSQASFDAAHG